MEVLRYLPYINKSSWIVTNSKPFVNIPDYPEEGKLFAELDTLPNIKKLDIEEVAKSIMMPKSANMVLLGMAAKYIEIVSVEQLKEAIKTVFARKGEAIVEANLKAFEEGMKN